MECGRFMTKDFRYSLRSENARCEWYTVGLLFSEKIDEVGVMWVVGVMGLESSKMGKEGMVWQVTFVCKRHIRVEVPCRVVL